MWGPPATPTGVGTKTGLWCAMGQPHEPTPGRGCPRCPAWLDADTQRAWYEIVPQLDAKGVLPRIDRDALIRYVITWGNWRKLQLFIEQHGATHQTGYQVHTPRPEADEVSVIEAHLRELEQSFGLTSAARPRLHALPPADPAPTCSRRTP